jgi:hypothetical protein
MVSSWKKYGSDGAIIRDFFDGVFANTNATSGSAWWSPKTRARIILFFDRADAVQAVVGERADPVRVLPIRIKPVRSA